MRAKTGTTVMVGLLSFALCATRASTAVALPPCLTVATTEGSTTAPASFENNGILVVHYNAGTTMAAAGPANISFVEIRNAQFRTSPTLPDPENYAMNVILPSPFTTNGTNLPPALTTLDLATGGIGELPFGGLPATWTIDFYNGVNTSGNLTGVRTHTVLFGSVCDSTVVFDPLNDGTNPPGTFDDKQLSKTLFRIDDDIYHSVNNPEVDLVNATVAFTGMPIPGLQPVLPFLLGISDLTEVGFSTAAGLLTGSSETFVNVWRVTDMADNTLSAVVENVLEFKLAPGSECVQPGDTVTVELHQRGLSQDVRGYQAFAQFDSLKMTNLTHVLTTSPYALSLINGVTVNDIDLAAGIDDNNGQLPTSADTLLATLTFTVVGTDGPTTVSFRTHSPPTRFSDVAGMEVTPFLIESPPIVIDSTNPVITCPANITVNNDLGLCSAIVVPGTATATDVGGSGVVSIVGTRDDTLPLTDPYPAGCAPGTVTTITWVATDCAGNTTSCMQTISVIDNEAPVVTCPAPLAGGLIISEIMDGTLPNGLPKFVELTNCSATPIDLANFSLGNINNGASTMGFNALVLSSILAPGDSYVVSYENGDFAGTGTFRVVYGFDPDNFDQGSFINGDDAVALFSAAALAGDPVDGSGATVVDVYGVIGVDGTGQVWEYADGFSFRKPFVPAGNGGAFNTLEWAFGGAGSLFTGDEITEIALMLANTTPGTHVCGSGEVVVFTDPGSCDAAVTLTASATDNCDGALPVVYEADLGAGFISITNPFTFPVGTWNVKASSTDACGNVGSCSFTVTVVDNEPPTATQGTIGACFPTAGDAEAAAIAATTNLADNCTTAGNFLVTASTVGDCNAVVTVSVFDEAGNVATFNYFTTVDGTPPVISCPDFATGDLIISEVLDGTLSFGKPKTIEITNCTPSAVDLSQYRIALFSNGSTTENTFFPTAFGDMTGMLTSGASFVIANPNSGPGAEFFAIYGFEADLYHGVANSNGDDVYSLLKNDGGGGDIVIDAYGVLGVDGSATAWEYLDSYAASLPGRSANGGIFDFNNWNIPGANALDGAGAAGIAAVTTPGTHVCSTTLTVNADAGGCAAVVTWTTPTAADNCDPVPAVNCSLPSGTNFGSGTFQVTCTATDVCGNSSQCAFDVTVNPFNEMVVSIKLQAVDPAPFTRCITFDLWNCPGDTAPAATVDEVMTFTGGLASATVLVPCGPYTCVTARDKLHTLRRTLDPLPISGTQYVADFVTPGKDLLGGNLNDDFFVDILDFGVFTSQFNTSFGTGDTTCATVGPHSDISGDGLVTTPDFTFIQQNFLLGHEPNCCGQPLFASGEGGSGPVTEITVAELRALGLGDLAVGDLNHDGVLNQTDVVEFMQGARPGPKPHRRPIQGEIRKAPLGG